LKIFGVIFDYLELYCGDDMELTSEQLSVLTIFKEHDMEEGEYLSIQTLNRERLNLPQDIQDNWNAFVIG